MNDKDSLQKGDPGDENSEIEGIGLLQSPPNQNEPSILIDIFILAFFY